MTFLCKYNNFLCKFPNNFYIVKNIEIVCLINLLTSIGMRKVYYVKLYVGIYLLKTKNKNNFIKVDLLLSVANLVIASFFNWSFY